MAKVVRREACPSCVEQGNDGSEDNLVVYEDHSFCFACGYLVGSKKDRLSRTVELPTLEVRALAVKGLGLQTLRAWGVGKEENSAWWIFPYFDREKKLCGYKQRNFKEQISTKKKSIYYEGQNELYGLHMIAPSVEEAIIWEGETDCLSGYQVNSYYAHLAIPGSGTAEKLLRRHATFLRSRFNKIYLVADNDDEGEKLRETVSEFLPVHLLFHARVPTKYKDFNDALLAGDGKTVFRKMIQEAVQEESDMLLTGDKLVTSFDNYLKDDTAFTGLSTGYPELDAMLGGGFHYGEVLALVGHTGRGKSTFAMNVAMNMASNLQDGEKIMWLGTEMEPNLMMRKFIEHEAGKIFSKLPSGKFTVEPDEVEMTVKRLSDTFVFYINMNSDFDRVKNGILNAVYQHKVRMVFIDVLSDIDTNFSDWKVAANIISEIHALAQGDTEDRRPAIGVFAVSHTVGEEGEIDLSNLRGGSAIKQKVTSVIAFEGDIEDDTGIRYLRVLKKSRVYDADKMDCKVFFNKDTRRYEAYSDDKEPNGRKSLKNATDYKSEVEVRINNDERTRKLYSRLRAGRERTKDSSGTQGSNKRVRQSENGKRPEATQE